MKRQILLLFMCIFIFSQTKELQAVKTVAAITVDGLEDQAWKDTKTYTGFKQLDPIPLDPATKKTEFKFLYDDENVYFYIKSYDNPENIVKESGKRDNAFNGDWVIIALSPLNDDNTGYEFLVNPTNSVGDARLFDGGNEDWDWDAIWYSGAQVVHDGWVAEIKIPLRELKFQSKDIQQWSFNVARKMKKNDEKVFYQPVDPNFGYKISRFAKINDLRGLKTRNELNLIPSVVSAFDSEKNYNPSGDQSSLGLDLKYNFDEQHSILATYNPDFAQIEADADEINLGDYPLYLREKRPFFLEGNSLYQLPDELYYSRKMARPKGGFKFFGNSSSFKYGMTYALNDGQEDENEHFIIPRLKYNKGTELEIGYLGGYLKTDEKFKFLGGAFHDSTYVNNLNDDLENPAYNDSTHGNKSGKLHTLDVRYRPNDQWDLFAFAATTVMDDVDESNESIRFQARYNTDSWYGYFRFQKKSNYFEQGLVGFAEANNTTEQNFNIGHKWRLKDHLFRQIRVNINVNHFGTYDNQIMNRNLNFNAHANHQFESVGFVGYGFGINNDSGDHRSYKRVVAPDSIAYYNEADGEQFDNYGFFNKRHDESTFFWSYAESDFSNPLAFAFNFEKGQSLGGDYTGFGFTVQVKPSDILKIKLRANFDKYGKSNFHLDHGKYKSFSLRTDYTVMKDLYIKVYSQFNPQDDGFSNNVIASYEYNRGSFIYFAFNEYGILHGSDADYKKGSLLKTYQLDQRTISLKWSSSLYL